MGAVATNTQAIALHPATGVLYYLDQAAGSNLHLFDRDTLADSVIGATGLPTPVVKLAFDSNGTLYAMHPSNTSDLYTIDINTGTATLFGTLDLGGADPLANSGDIAFDFDNDTLWVQSSFPFNNRLFSVDIGTLDATLECSGIFWPGTRGLGVANGGTVYISSQRGIFDDTRTIEAVNFPGSGTSCSLTEVNSYGSATAFIDDLTSGIDEETVPVTLSSFRAEGGASEVSFEWSTATEIGNVGFHLYDVTDGVKRRLNENLIPSHKINSDAPLSYSFSARSLAEEFYIADVDLRGREQRHGPFQLGESYGKAVEPESVDWASIRGEVEAKSAYAKAVSRETDSFRWVARRSRGLYQTPNARLAVSKDGLYRVAYETLKAAGVDLRGVRRDSLTLTGPGGAAGMHVGGPEVFGPGSFVVFHGEGADSLYTRTNNYTLTASEGGLRFPWHWYDAASFTKGTGPGVYQAVVTHQRQREYAPHSPSDDPWFDTRLLAYTSPVSHTFTFDVTDLAAGEGQLDLEIWGVTGWPVAPDHHATVALNGVEIADELFDGLVLKSISAALPDGLLQEGTNSLTITLPGDTGANWDVVDFDGFTVRYPREMIAEGGVLAFDTAGGDITVDGFPTANIVAYRVAGGEFVGLDGLDIEASGLGYQASFNAPAGTYVVAAEEALATPGVEAAPNTPDITSGRAEYLIISHPHFLDGLEPFVSARTADGYDVKVVDVEHVYAKFSSGTVAPQAIRDYIAHAAAEMGTEYVLLVGGDSYDYLDYTGAGSLSFIPTPYTHTGFGISFGPGDPVLADPDGDLAPDVALGRWPVRTEAELASIIEKTLAYTSAGHGRAAVFAADAQDGSSSFAAVSDQFISLLPAGWDVERAYIDDLGVDGARDVLLSEINNGVAFASFFGHSGPTNWTYDGLFSNVDATGLRNAGKPTVVSQWGCWNTYYVSPAYNTMAHHLLLSGDRGAAATWGAAVLTQVGSERVLGGLVMSRLFQPGMTIGKAIQSAKSELAQTNPEMLDVLVGWSLLGDPAIEINQ